MSQIKNHLLAGAVLMLLCGTSLVMAEAAADESWFIDDDGREYRIENLPKEGAHIVRGEDGKVRYNWYTVYDVVGEDEEFFFAKVYRAADRTGKVFTEPTEDELATAAANYAVSTPESDRVRFEKFDHGLPQEGQWRNGFDLVDMNGDGHLDILHGPARKGSARPKIFLGDGKGHWSEWQAVRFPNVDLDYGDAAGADFNGDGHMDIALAMHLSGLVAAIGDGKGNFTLWSDGIDLEIPGKGGDASGFSSREIEIVDWNGDGRPDILALGEGPRPGGQVKGRGFGIVFAESFGAMVYLNQGDGTWKRYSQGNDRRQVFGDSIDVGDFNADGRLDFVTASNTFNLRSVVHVGQDDGSWAASPVEAIVPRGYIRAVDVGDYNRDGRDDVALSYTNMAIEIWRTGIDILYAQPDGSWQRRPLAVEDSRRGVFALDHGDLDGDGELDLVALTGDGHVVVFLGDGEGFFTHEKSDEIPTPPGGCRGYHVQLEDIDGDGRDEVVASFAGAAVALFAPNRCKLGGALTAWKTVPLSDSPATAQEGP